MIMITLSIGMLCIHKTKPCRMQVLEPELDTSGNNRRWFGVVRAHVMQSTSSAVKTKSLAHKILPSLQAMWPLRPELILVSIA